MPSEIAARTIPARRAQPPAGRRVAFVLTGGASHGAVQVGMLEALLGAGIQPDLLVGASVGSLNAVAFGADPSPRGLARLDHAWRSARRSDVFPLWSPSLVLGAIGKRDHLLENRGVAELIRRVVPVERLEQTVLPVHVVATDLSSGEPVVLSEGPIVPALLASTAIPAVFAPVDVGGRLLVDGGVSADTPTLQAESLGASTIYVLPTYGASPGEGPRRSALSVGLYAIGRLLSSTGHTTVAATRDAVVHVLPTPPTSGISPFDLSRSAALIEDAERLTTEWLEGHEVEDATLAYEAG